MDSTVYALNASEASLLLGSRSYYEEAKQLGDQVTPLLETFILTMFDMAGYSEEEAAQHWQAAQAFDATLVPLVLTNVHAPGKLRVNVQLGNCDTFYEVYGVQEGDGMYIAPEERVSIW